MSQLWRIIIGHDLGKGSESALQSHLPLAMVLPCASSMSLSRSIHTSAYRTRSHLRTLQKNSRNRPGQSWRPLSADRLSSRCMQNTRYA